MKKEEMRDNSFGIVGVVFGILSVLSVSAVGVVLGAVGLVFSIVQNKRFKEKWGKAGIILNAIGIVLGIVAIVLYIKYGGYLNQIQQLQGAP